MSFFFLFCRFRICSVFDGVFEVRGGEIDVLPSLVLVDKEAGKGVVYEGDVEDAEVKHGYY